MVMRKFGRQIMRGIMGKIKSSDFLADVIVKFVEERLKITYSHYNERLLSSLGTWLALGFCFAGEKIRKIKTCTVLIAREPYV